MGKAIRRSSVLLLGGFLLAAAAGEALAQPRRELAPRPELFVPEWRLAELQPAWDALITEAHYRGAWLTPPGALYGYRELEWEWTYSDGARPAAVKVAILRNGQNIMPICPDYMPLPAVLDGQTTKYSFRVVTSVPIQDTYTILFEATYVRGTAITTRIFGFVADVP